MPHSHPAPITVHIGCASELDDALAAAVDALKSAAMRSPCCGILLTREAPGRYTAALDEGVPYGFTRERTR